MSVMRTKMILIFLSAALGIIISGGNSLADGFASKLVQIDGISSEGRLDNENNLEFLGLALWQKGIKLKFSHLLERFVRWGQVYKQRVQLVSGVSIALPSILLPRPPTPTKTIYKSKFWTIVELLYPILGSWFRREAQDGEWKLLGQKRMPAEFSKSSSPTLRRRSENYRLVGDTLIINKSGYLTNAKYRISGDEMVLSAPDFSAVLKRLQ